MLQAAVARASAYARAQVKTANPPKQYAVKTRGPNKQGAKAAKQDGEDVIELD